MPFSRILREQRNNPASYGLASPKVGGTYFFGGDDNSSSSSSSSSSDFDIENLTTENNKNIITENNQNIIFE